MEEGFYQVYSVKNVGWLTGGGISPVIPPKHGTKATLSHLSISPQHHGQSKPVKVCRLHSYFFWFMSSSACVNFLFAATVRDGVATRWAGGPACGVARSRYIDRTRGICLIPALGYRAGIRDPAQAMRTRGRWVKVVCPAELRRYYVHWLRPCSASLCPCLSARLS